MSDFGCMRMRVPWVRALPGAAVLLLVVIVVQAGGPYRYAQYNRAAYQRYLRSLATNQAAHAKLAQPQEKPQKFRDLTVGAVFYYLADKDRKLFPWKKVSDTYARSVPTPGQPNATLAAVPGESLVLVKADPKKSKATGNHSATATHAPTAGSPTGQVPP